VPQSLNMNETYNQAGKKSGTGKDDFVVLEKTESPRHVEEETPEQNENLLPRVGDEISRADDSSGTLKGLQSIHFDQQLILKQLDKLRLSAMDSVLQMKKGHQFLQKGLHKAALICFQHALSIEKSKLEPNHPDFIPMLHVIGCCYESLNEYDAARKYFHDELQLRIETFGEKDQELISMYQTLGNSYEKTEDWTLASTNYAKMMDIVNIFKNDLRAGNYFDHFGNNALREDFFSVNYHDNHILSKVFDAHIHSKQYKSAIEIVCQFLHYEIKHFIVPFSKVLEDNIDDWECMVSIIINGCKPITSTSGNYRYQIKKLSFLVSFQPFLLTFRRGGNILMLSGY